MKELAELQTELDAYGACDPVKVEEKRRAAVLAREAALRHTGLGLSIPTTPRRPRSRRAGAAVAIAVRSNAGMLTRATQIIIRCLCPTLLGNTTSSRRTSVPISVLGRTMKTCVERMIVSAVTRERTVHGRRDNMTCDSPSLGALTLS